MNYCKALLLFAVLAAPAFAQPVIESASPDVAAADLAGEVAVFRQADPSAVVARAPLPGVTRRVRQTELQRWADGLGLDPLGLPEEVILRRATRPLTTAEIDRAVADSVGATDVAVEILSGAEPSVPTGEIAIECLCTRLTLNRPTPLRIRWRETGGRTGVEQLQAIITVIGEWYEAAGSFPAGTAVTSSHVVAKRGALPEGVPYLTADQLDGRWSLLRAVKLGQPLTSDLVRSVPLVSRGDLVELRYEVGGVRLRSPGRAEAAGSPGDLLPFHNIGTGGRVSARLADQETAYVEAVHAAR